MIQIMEQGERCNSVDWWEALVRVPTGMHTKRSVYYAYEMGEPFERVSSVSARYYVPGVWLKGGIEDARFYLENRHILSGPKPLGGYTEDDEAVIYLLEALEIPGPEGKKERQ